MLSVVTVMAVMAVMGVMIFVMVASFSRGDAGADSSSRRCCASMLMMVVLLLLMSESSRSGRGRVVAARSSVDGTASHSRSSAWCSSSRRRRRAVASRTSVGSSVACGTCRSRVARVVNVLTSSAVVVGSATLSLEDGRAKVFTGCGGQQSACQFRCSCHVQYQHQASKQMEPVGRRLTDVVSTESLSRRAEVVGGSRSVILLELSLRMTARHGRVVV